MNAFVCAVEAGLSVLGLIALLVMLRRRKTRKRSLGKGDTGVEQEGFAATVYTLIFGDRDPMDVAMVLGVHPERYEKACRVIHKAPDLRGVILCSTAGLLVLVVGAVLGLLVSLLWLVIALVVCLLLIRGPVRLVEGKAEAARAEFSRDLVPFLNILQCALEAGLPVERAIGLISERMDGILAKEIRAAYTDAKLGAVAWTDVLESVAEIYEVDRFSELVLNVSGAIRRGVPITEVVERQNRETKTSHLADMRQAAGAATNYILLPTAVCQLLPIVGIMLVPVLVSLKGGIY